MPAKSTVFCNYLVRLHYDLKELELFKKHPDERIHLAGLTPEQGNALKSKSVAKIEAALCEEEGLPAGSKAECNHVVKTQLVEKL